MKILITGGAGFIGSAVIRYILKIHTTVNVLNIDKLTYAGNLEALNDVSSLSNYTFEKVDICDKDEINRIFQKFKPDAVMHLAAESHVDRSIDGPAQFIQTNIVGTYNLLESARNYWNQLVNEAKEKFRFHHISTDEVYGSLGQEGLFTESSPYKPNSPYSASKASSDHIVRAWHKTYGLPVIITNCSNNYGPYQFPEKLIPLTILNALNGKPLPVYGKGEQVRDWLYVEDHARALYLVLTAGKVGETYNIGGHNEKKNINLVEDICELLEELVPDRPKGVNAYKDLIRFVEDRPGHDQRYAIDSRKIEHDLGWKPIETVSSGLKKTIHWYLDNLTWCHSVQQGKYQQERLGLIDKVL